MKVVITDYQYENIDAERSIITGAGHELFDYQIKEGPALFDIVRDADAVITQYSEITREVIAHMEHCRMIIKYGIGVNNIDCKAASEKGIFVCNVPDYGIDEVSNHACTMLLMLSKKINVLALALRNGDWGYSSIVPLTRFSESTLGLVGFGRIPQLVAKKMRGFGVRILAYDPYINEKTAGELSVTPVDLETLLKESDYVSIHCPLAPDTYHLINEENIRLMKPGAAVVNTARGGIIDEEALILALREKRLGGAGIDVFENEPVSADHPLLYMDNVIATPHSAWYSDTAIHVLQRKAAEEVVNVLAGNPPFNCVNLRELA